jgi:hypothetical protein
MMCLQYTLIIRPAGAGDEGYFMQNLDLLGTEHWFDLISKGNAINFSLPTYFLSLFTDTYFALRMFNLFIFTLFIYYLIVKLNYTDWIYISILIMYTSVTSYMFYGTNDALFTLSLAIFLIEVYYFILTHQLKNPTWTILSLLTAISTREISIFYLPVILVSLYIIRKNLVQINTRNYLFIFIFSVVLFLINIPSIVTRMKPSYDNKEGKYGITWSQRGYFWQLKNPDSKDKSQPSWEEVRAYLDLHGEKSLPKSYFEGIFFDLELTIKDFFVDFIDALKGVFRQLGVLALLPILLIFARNNSYKKGLVFVAGSYYLVLSLFSFVIITYVELRWMGAVSILLIISSSSIIDGIMKDYKNSVYMNYAKISVILNFILLGIYGIITYSKLVNT